MSSERTIEKLLRQQAALAHFGSFAFDSIDLGMILSEAARICAESLDVPFTKICRYRPEQNDLLVVAGFGWESNVVGNVISQADESSTQGRAFVTGLPVILENIDGNNSYDLPDFYDQHHIVSTVDVLIKGASGPFGVLEADSAVQRTFDVHDINFLTGFANVLAEAVGTSERTATLQATLTQMEVLITDKEILREEKGTLSAELQTRVRNNLQLVYGMLIRQIGPKEDGGNEGIRAIARRVMGLATIYDHLLGHGLAQSINFGSYLQSLCNNLHQFQEKSKHQVTLTAEVVSITLELDLVTVLGIIVTEITSNAYLHAFPNSPGHIIVKLVKGDGKGTLIISDDGVGFIEDEDTNHHGISLIKRLMDQIGGVAQLQSGDGTTWTLTFPFIEDNRETLGRAIL